MPLRIWGARSYLYVCAATRTLSSGVDNGSEILSVRTEKELWFPRIENLSWKEQFTTKIWWAKKDICNKIIDTLVTDCAANPMCSWHDLNILSHPWGGSGSQLGSEQEPNLGAPCPREEPYQPATWIRMLWAYLFSLVGFIFLPLSSSIGLRFILRHNGRNEISKTFAGQENHFLPSSISASKILFGSSFSELILPLSAIWSTVVF